MNKKGKTDKALGRVFIWGIVVGILLGCFIGLYFGHVHATKQFISGFADMKIEEFQFTMGQDELNSFMGGISMCEKEKTTRIPSTVSTVTGVPIGPNIK